MSASVQERTQGDLA